MRAMLLKDMFHVEQAESLSDYSCNYQLILISAYSFSPS